MTLNPPESTATYPSPLPLPFALLRRLAPPAKWEREGSAPPSTTPCSTFRRRSACLPPPLRVAANAVADIGDAVRGVRLSHLLRVVSVGASVIGHSIGMAIGAGIRGSVVFDGKAVRPPLWLSSCWG